MEVTTTAHSDCGPLLRVAMKHPRDAFISQTVIDGTWRDFNFAGPPNFVRACREFDALLRLLEDHGARVSLLPEHSGTGLDSIYVRDAALATNRGIVLCHMGKAVRVGEPEAQAAALAALGITVVGSVTGVGTVEGGDVAWIAEDTLAIGHGYRTNADGIRQLRLILSDLVPELIVVPLPHWNGRDDVMHLMSLISPVAPGLVLGYSRLLPVPFRTLLLDRGITLLEVPDEEFTTMGGNVLVIAPRTVVLLAGNPRTRLVLEAAGIHVLEYTGVEISMKGSGGPTCLTRPLLRSR